MEKQPLFTVCQFKEAKESHLIAFEYKATTQIGFLWLSELREFRIKQVWALQCDPDEIKCNQDKGRTMIIQVELYTLIFLKYWLGMWIWIKDLGSVSAED